MTATANPIELGLPEQEIKKPEPNDQRLWSVTTIIGVLDKPALLYWAAEQTAKAACSISKSLTARIDEDGEENVVKFLRDARFRRAKGMLSDSEFGTQMHALCERYALTGERPTPSAEMFGADLAAAVACLDRFSEWLDAFQPSYQATEVMVATPSYGIAGTTDGFMTIDGVRMIFDLKFSKKSYDARGKPTGLYPEVALQLAAYRFSELAAVWRPRRFEVFRRRYYALSKAEIEMAAPVPEVDAGLGIKITPEYATASPVRCDEDVYRYFLNCLEVARFQFDVAKDVIGAPLTPPERAS